MTQDETNRIGVHVTDIPEAEPSDIDTQMQDLVGLGVKIDAFVRPGAAPGSSATVTRNLDGTLHVAMNLRETTLETQRGTLVMVHRIARDEIHLAPGDTIDLMPK